MLIGQVMKHFRTDLGNTKRAGYEQHTCGLLVYSIGGKRGRNTHTLTHTLSHKHKLIMRYKSYKYFNLNFLFKIP